jgi:hypothetical protein
LIGGLTAYLPQNYWTDFQRPWQQVMEAAAANVEPLGPTEPILPYKAVAADMEACIAWCEERAYASTSLWRMGTANAGQLAAFGGPAAVPATPTEPSEQPSAQPGESPTTSPDGIPQTYLDRGWDSWPTVAIKSREHHPRVDRRTRCRPVQAGRGGTPKRDAVTCRQVKWR